MHATHPDTRSWLWIALLALVLLAGPQAVIADGPTADEIQAGSLLLRMEHGYAVATRLNTDVDMQISGVVARVSVRQEFVNTSNDWVEGVYVFPLPDRAAVDRMRVHIGERFIEGEIQEKEHAKKLYQQAKSTGRKAGLVEQQRANMFTSSVANIAPGERVVIEIEYLEDVRFEDGQFSIRFPMTLTPRYVSEIILPDRKGNRWPADAAPVIDASLITAPQVMRSNAHRMSLTANVNAGGPLEIIASRYHPISVDEKNSQYSISFSDGDVAMDHDFELLWQLPAPSTPRAMIFTETIEGKPYYLLMVMPPELQDISGATLPRETIFIIDTSGSMHGVSIAQAKAAVQLALKGLQPGDRFNVVEFNSVTNSLYKHSRAVTPATLLEASGFVAQLQANGGTEMRPALSLALSSLPSEEHLRQIVFITDGSVGYEHQMFSMIEDKLGAARLFTVGIGAAPNSLFMRKAAEVGRGSYTFISALHEVREKMDALFRKLEQPQVTNIEVQWPGGVIAGSFPSRLPDLYAGEPVTVLVEVSGQLRDDDVVHISGDSIGGAWSVEIPVELDQDSPGVAALWARARIAELLDLERRHPGSGDIRTVIVDTALTHHLVSKYTSLVAVDKTPARPLNAPLDSEQVPNLTPYGQSGNAISGFPATATNAPLMRLLGFLSVLAALFIMLLQPGRSSARCARPH